MNQLQAPQMRYSEPPETEALLHYWGLHARPFELVGDTRFFYDGEEYAEVLARLNYLVQEQTMYFGMLTGEIGCGKSITRRVFSGRIDPTRHTVVEFENSVFSFKAMSKRVFTHFGLANEAAEIEGRDDALELFRHVINQLTNRHHLQLVLLFDEAQDMDIELLKDLKRLSNLNDEGQGEVTIVLIGQPELRELVESLPPLDQRIGLRFHLRPMNCDQADLYVSHRLIAAGHITGELFTREGLDILWQAARGFPREMNRLAKLSLETARAERGFQVEAGHVMNVVEDLRKHQSMPQVVPPIRGW